MLLLISRRRAFHGSNLLADVHGTLNQEQISAPVETWL